MFQPSLILPIAEKYPITGRVAFFLETFPKNGRKKECMRAYPEGVIHSSPGQRPGYDSENNNTPKGLYIPAQGNALGYDSENTTQP
jgi:hypothetical protein